MGFPSPTRSFARMLLSGVLLAVPLVGHAQTPAPAAMQPAPHKPPTKEASKPKPHTPVVHPHGPAHPVKPPAARQPEKPLPPAVPAEPTPVPAAPPPAPAKPPEAAKPAGTGLPLPRFAAMRSDDVNLRAGPGFRYPIEWVYKRRDLPVEIEREFEVWRLVRDAEGTRGWVHEATLTRRRTFVVQGADATLRSDPKDDASPRAILNVGVIGRIRSCEANSDWCQVQVGEYRGYLRREQFWGTLPNEAVSP